MPECYSGRGRPPSTAMSVDHKAPALDNRCICIVDQDSRLLAAVVSSYLSKPQSYLPFFLFPRVTSPYKGDNYSKSVEFAFNSRAYSDRILINNAWARMGGSEFVVLVGLTDEQKSYLLVPQGTKIIAVSEPSEAHAKLAPLGVPTGGELRCSPSNILIGLSTAQKNSKFLVIDEAAPSLAGAAAPAGGLVVVENVADASPVVAINYANSVGASISVVDPLPVHEARTAQNWIQEWKQNDDQSQLQKLKDAVSQRVSASFLNQFEYATFFTEGIPYTLILGNTIPCSYVNLSISPDLFVLNCILFDRIERFRSAVVFSPVFFKDEETEWLCDFLGRSSYYVRKLTGQEATLANFDFHAQFFPYDILHICSHGGEVEGYAVSDKFTDEKGNIHTVEYDEVIGYTPAPDEDGLVEVHRKALPRKLDGLAWMSQELLNLNLPMYVFKDMWQNILHSAEMDSTAERAKKGPIPMSCAIACSDSIHQGEFSILASHTSPIIFNNTCWSWHEVSLFFLACGASGYIGTLWDIRNADAVIGAQTFYANLFSGSVLKALHQALRAINASESKDIYIYWGLHFTRVSPGRSSAESQRRVFSELVGAVNGWTAKILATKSPELKRNSIRVLTQICQELNANFGARFKNLEALVNAKIKELSAGELSRESNRAELTETSRSADFPTERRPVRKS
jgi:hypothetical protein